MKTLLLLTLVASTPSFGAEEKKDRCEAEREKFCKPMKADDPNLRGCLKARMKELSAECQKQVEQMPVRITRKKWRRGGQEE